MRSIIKLQSDVPKHPLKGAVEMHFDSVWLPPINEQKTVEALIGRVYPEYIDEIRGMDNCAFIHKTIPDCELLISHKDKDIQVRIFHDHIVTLRELTGAFLKRFYDKIVKAESHSFKIDEIAISEAQKNNLLDTGACAVRRLDYCKKIWADRHTEIIFFFLVFAIAAGTLGITIAEFGTPSQKSLPYELASKVTGPFLASSILTLTNLVIYYWKLRTSTNILWGMRRDSNNG
jgi:hypothetical protein